MGWSLVRSGVRGFCLIALLTGGCCALWLLVRDPFTDLGQAWIGGGVAGVLALPFTQALTGLCACIVLLGSAWLAGTTSLAVLLAVGQAASRGSTCRLERVLGQLLGRTPVRLFCPALAQRLALAFCGIALGSGLGSGLGSAPAVADSPGDLGSSGDLLDLGGLEVPDRTSGARSGVVFTRVARGDSLWSISTRLLPAGAADADIVAAWQELYRVNREEIGPNPDLIFPGTTLQVPPPADQERKEHP